MKYIYSIALGLALVLSGMNSFADTLKIGVVDLQKVMQTTPHVQDVKEKLEKEFKPRHDKLLEVETNLKKDMATFKKDSAVMSQTQRSDLEKKIVEAQQQFERDGQQYQQELNAAHNAAMEKLFDKVRAAIAKVAAADKYDLVLQKEAAPFSAEKLDITTRVTQALKG